MSRSPLSAWNATGQAELLIEVIRRRTDRLAQLLTATSCDHAELRRHVRMLVAAAESLERARIALEASIER